MLNIKPIINWFTGIIEDIDDPLKKGRVRVRCLGYHNDDKNKLPTSSLPWSWCLLPVTSPSFQGIGTSPSLLVGSWVMGVFRDGEDCQEPIILGSLCTQTNGIDDIPANAKTNYPFRQVIRTLAGHEIILDNKEGEELINIEHASGSYIQMSSNGDITIDAGTSTLNLKAGRINLIENV